MQRNIQLYPIYLALSRMTAWLPIFFLYFSEHLSLAQVLLLEALYYVSVVLLEVPSGYFSDAIGRHPTLLISSMAFALSYALFVIAGGVNNGAFVFFAIAQVLLATGFAFSSGTDTSFHYDSLAALGRAEEYGQREAVAERNGFIASSVAILLGGLAGMVALRFAYLISLLGALGAVVVVLYFREPTTQDSPTMRTSFVEQLRLCVWYLQQPSLRWIFLFAVLMTILNHIPYEFYQSYLDLLRGDLALASNQTPLVAAIVMSISTLLGAAAASRSIWLDKQLGTAATLLVATAIQTGIIIAMGVILHPLIVPLILLRAVPSGLMRAPMNAAIAPQVPQAQRATYLSIQSLAGRLAFSVTLVGLSWLVGSASADWPTLALMLQVSAGLGLFGWAFLFITRRRIDS